LSISSLLVAVVGVKVTAVAAVLVDIEQLLHFL
jgi:hypothetical protein